MRPLPPVWRPGLARPWCGPRLGVNSEIKGPAQARGPAEPAALTPARAPASAAGAVRARAPRAPEAPGARDPSAGEGQATGAEKAGVRSVPGRAAPGLARKRPDGPGPGVGRVRLERSSSGGLGSRRGPTRRSRVIHGPRRRLRRPRCVEAMVSVVPPTTGGQVLRTVSSSAGRSLRWVMAWRTSWARRWASAACWS